MKILTRYLLRAHLGPFLFAFCALTGIVLINTFAQRLADLAGKGLPLDIVARFFLLSLPSNIALTFPMAVLVSVLYTFTQLAAENEMTALKASGVDLKRLVLPLLVVAGGITAGMVFFNAEVLPESNHRWRQLMVDIGRKSPLLTLHEQTLNALRTGDGRSRYYLQAARIDHMTNRMRDVVIYDVSDPRIGRTIYADSGRMAFNEDRTDLFLRLFDGHLREINFDEPQNFQRLAFRRQVLRMVGVGNKLELQEGSGYRGDREMTAAMLHGRIDTLRTELWGVRSAVSTAAMADLDRALGRAVPTAAAATALPSSDPAAEARRIASDLRSSQARTSSLERQIREYQVEVQKKYSIAAAALVFVLIGAPLGVRFPRGGIGMVIAASLTIFALYYVSLIAGEALGDAGHVPPVVAMWGMNAIFAALGLWGLSRMGRETGTARGGGLAEWLSDRFGRKQG
ncbi:MAG: LptF/LptG family permease [Gemmatimonadetes bacterium]|nr:LptF/LptG family permease [Gemmatimonadota bacterium]